jgi:hypothetical protein
MQLKVSVFLYATPPLAMIIFFGAACTPKINPPGFVEDGAGAVRVVPEYSKIEYWAAHPGKRDPSDTVPLPLNQGTKEKTVDVFFLHPTTLTKEDNGMETNARVDDSGINEKTDRTAILYQASAFNERARVYAPRYRQAHISMYNEKDSSKKVAAFSMAYEDVRNAFVYYLENENKGRPIVVASHSQGTTHATRLIEEFFDGKPLADQLVCAYLIGIGVKKNQYKKIPLCQDSLQTGCFVSWRTFREDYDEGWATHNDTGIAVVNPLIWSTNNALAGREYHKGAVLYNLNKVYTQTHSAKAEGSGLWISRPRFPGSFLYNRKNYHAGDINLFYINIRENVSDRVDQFFLENNKGHNKD